MEASVMSRVHCFRNPDGTFRYSGYNACGDAFDGAGERSRDTKPPRPFDAIMDVGPYTLYVGHEDALLYFPANAPPKLRTHGWTATEVVLAARLGWFGFKLVSQ